VTKVGQKVTFDTSIKDYAGKAIPVDHKELHRFIKKDHRILIDDGRVEAVTIKVVGTVVTAKIVQADLIKSHKGINLPDSHVAIPALSDKDRSDLHFGVLAGVDMVGLSFVSSPKDIHDVRKLIAEIAKKEKITLQPIAIIAKIERVEAVAAIAEIVESADGVMVARGDLGLELPTSEVPVIQKRIIEEANRQAKPVIVATQLLNSMQTSRRPTRAEASDVANAVIDHADALLLTNETASGDYPVLAVKTMSDIIRSTESSVYDDLPFIPTYKKNLPIDTVLANAVRLMTDETDIHAAVV
jgi:pyruvate kinase